MRHCLPQEPDRYCFIDTETRSPYDVKLYGAYRHNRAGRVTVLTYAIGDGPLQAWSLGSFENGARLDWRDAPDDLREHLDRAALGEAWFVAWNAAFDRLSMSWGMDNAPVDAETGLLSPRLFLDAMAQGAKSHLPPDLDGAAAYTGADYQKIKDGKRLIQLFAPEDGSTPQTAPEDWRRFIEYALYDTGALRDVWFGTLPLDAEEWEEYWASERINDRGLPFDIPFARRAAKLAALVKGRANEAMRELTGGVVTTVNQNVRLLEWVQNALRYHPEAERILTREIVVEPDEAGEDVRTVEHSLSRDRVEALIAYLKRVDEAEGLTDEERDCLQLLDVRLYGASATPGKFEKVVRMATDGRVCGQYTFNGAPATGRYSSRGLQVHNLTRDTVGTAEDELAAIEIIGALRIDDDQH